MWPLKEDGTGKTSPENDLKYYMLLHSTGFEV